jgi:hypothetical protein
MDWATELLLPLPPHQRPDGVPRIGPSASFVLVRDI